MTRSPKTSRQRLADLVGGFRRRRVAVIGDLVADEFVHGDIARVSREAPVLILEHRESVLVPGGGANAVVNLRALGAAPVPIGVVGDDHSGHRVLDVLRRTGVDTSGIQAEKCYETPTKSRIIAGGVHTRRQQIVRIDRGARHGPLPREVLARIRARLRRAVGFADGLLVADYGYGAAAPSVLSNTLPRRRGFFVTVDSRERVTSFRGVAACTPNQEELERALGPSPLRSEEAVRAAGRELLRLTRNRAVLVTRGAQGMSLFEPDRAPVAIPAFGSDEVADVTGAGDTVIAVFTLSLLAGASFFEAAVLSNVAAGLVVMKAGTATTSPDEMLDAIRDFEIP